MNVTSRRGPWPLHWRAVLAGGVLAIAAGWTGELLGGLVSLIEPGEGSAWAWLGGILALALLAGGTFAGAWVATRIAGTESRLVGLLHGLVVWGLVGTSSALFFAVLGGNLALVAGATAGAVRLAVGFAMLGLLAALLAAAAGGVLAAAPQRPAREARGSRSARVEIPDSSATTVVAGSRRDEQHERGSVPPSVH